VAATVTALHLSEENTVTELARARRNRARRGTATTSASEEMS
jgi:hypothetical protein